MTSRTSRPYIIITILYVCTRASLRKVLVYNIMQPLDTIKITKDYVYYYIRVSVKHNV